LQVNARYSRIISIKNDRNRICFSEIFLTVTFLIFVFTVCKLNFQQYGIALDCRGDTVAMLTNEEVYEKFIKLISKSNIPIPATYAKLRAVNYKKIANSAGIALTKITEKTDFPVMQGCGLCVDDKLVCISENETEIDEILNQEIDSYDGDNKKFIEKLEKINGVYLKSEFLSKDLIKEKLFGENKAYTVVDGDTISSISQKLGVSTNFLSKLNNIKNNKIKIGDVLYFGNNKRILNIENKICENSIVNIPFKKIEKLDKRKPVGFKKIERNGKNGIEKYIAEKIYINGKFDRKKIINRSVLTNPVDEILLVGTSNHFSSQKNGHCWPVSYTKNITSGYGIRWGKVHDGIDIAKSGIYGKEIVSTNHGRVLLAGWYGGYGLCVIIYHTDSTKTLYGHCSKVYVKSGQKVYKGQPIALVGASGFSTGPHLHYGVKRCRCLKIRCNCPSINPLTLLRR